MEISRISTSGTFLQEVQQAVDSALSSSGRSYIHFNSKTKQISTSQSEENTRIEVAQLLNDLSQSVFDSNEYCLLECNVSLIKKIISVHPTYSNHYAEEIKTLETMLTALGLAKKQSEKVKTSYISQVCGVEQDKFNHRNIYLQNGKEMGLNEFQAECAFLYTTQAYKLLNSFLRGHHHSMVEEAQNLTVLETIINKHHLEEHEAIKKLEMECSLVSQGVVEAFKHLPKFEGDAFRADWLSEEEWQRILTGTYSDSAPLSCSSNQFAAFEFLKRKPNPTEKYPVFITIENSTQGHALGKISCNPHEEEVLFPPKREFEVIIGELVTVDYIAYEMVDYNCIEETKSLEYRLITLREKEG